MAVACAVIGSRLIVISALGSPCPLLDQWNGEADRLYAPYLKGALSFADLMAPHNEHRIFVFRVLALIHLELAGEWNTRLEMILGAITLTATVTWLAALLMPLVAPQRRILLACFVAFVFAFPIAYENALWGFQCQVYLALFFGIAALVAFAPAGPFSLRWFAGLAAAVLSCLSFATGVATVLAAGGLVGLQLATNARKRSVRELAAVAVLASVAVGVIMWESSGANPMSTPWTFLQGLLLFTGAIILAVIPLAWFCWHTLARRPAVSERAWILVGIVGWVAVQVVMLAYGRGNLVAPRYMDIVLFVYPPALVAVFAFADRARAARFSRYVGPGAAIWVFTVVAAGAMLGYASVLMAIEWSKSAADQAADVRSYIATGNVDDLRAKGGRGQTVDLSYPLPQLLAGILRDPEERAILPSELRPPDADNAGARNRMWLKGAPAGVTATAVRILPWISPALLALGVSLFFAVGARRDSFDPHSTCGG
ncbi:hypothetical protein [Mycobacterium sp. 852002-51057_SCH5723018]|uniref:hypothetical protein n=1 Tax=Mycobacterium sp. 852002-51057_SCH5723018 TaxID=1834094 RepID=UPI0012E8521B|nr:hypothetical protein [Mycobacterium sp. 852002-51057_SCH5723018]